MPINPENPSPLLWERTNEDMILAFLPDDPEKAKRLAGERLQGLLHMVQEIQLAIDDHKLDAGIDLMNWEEELVLYQELYRDWEKFMSIHGLLTVER